MTDQCDFKYREPGMLRDGHVCDKPAEWSLHPSVPGGAVRMSCADHIGAQVQDQVVVSIRRTGPVRGGMAGDRGLPGMK